jgi:transmembrane sensor
MALNQEQYEALYNKYIQNQCTAEELQTLIDELGEDSPAFQAELITRLFDKTWDGLEVFPGKYKLPDLTLPEERHETPVVALASGKKWRLRIAAAAAIILLLGAGSYWWVSRAPKFDLAATNKYSKNDVAPGGNKAVLTLANGTSIILDSVHNGTVAQQGNTIVVKQNNGQLAYHTENEKPTEILYNTLTTPRGGQYQLVLPDGSKIWLNAASSIRYPTAFAGKERKIEITGEAYFEVAKNTGMPFIIKANGMEVMVLGTHFNVNAYDDEAAIKTTLLEGAVKITKDAATAILRPGQQSRLTKSGKLNIINDVDLEDAVAWKNGLFSFKRADTKAVMRQIARWYDVEIVYESQVPSINFGGEMKRDLNLSQALKGLGRMGLRFRIEEKKLVVLP